MAVINNQGYRRDLNLSETEDEESAISNLMGTGIDAVSYTHLTLPTNREV